MCDTRSLDNRLKRIESERCWVLSSAMTIKVEYLPHSTPGLTNTVNVFNVLTLDFGLVDRGFGPESWW